MKHTYIKALGMSIMLMSAGFIASAQQNFEFDGDIEVFAAPEEDGASELSIHVDIKNISGQTLEVEVERTNMSVYQAGAGNRFCWGGNCFFESTDVSPLTYTMTNNQVVESNEDDFSGFTGYYNYNGNEGLSMVRYCFRDTSNPEIESCFTAEYCVGGDCEQLVGVDELQALGTLGNISPNPVKDISTLSYQLQGVNSGNITVYSLTGEEVMSVQLDSQMGFVVLDASQFEAGIYFYALESNGQTLAMKKLMVTK